MTKQDQTDTQKGGENPTPEPETRQQGWRDGMAVMWSSVKSYFNINNNLIPQEEAEAAIRDGVNFRGTNMLILIFAIFIASLGLNTNSTAVIIGAMLISPLMGPIIGMGLGVGIHDFELIKRSGRNLLMAALFSVAASTLYFIISPVNENHSELLARTSPTIYDVLIAFFGGAAGIVAMGSRSKGNVLPGVAIATALMPPLCTAGYGLATLQFHYFIGATYLFIINSIYIGAATVVGVKLMGYNHKKFIAPERARKVSRMVMILVVVTAIPSIFLTYSMIRDNSFIMRAGQFVGQEFQFPATKVLSYSAKTVKGKRELTVTLIGKILPQDSLELAMNGKLAKAGLSGTSLSIIQGDSPSMSSNELSSSSVKDIYQVAQATIGRQMNTIDSLRYALRERAQADTIGAAIAPELRVMFPQVSQIAVTHPTFNNVTSGALDSTHVVLVKYATPLPQPTEKKFTEYLEARLGLKNIYLVNVGNDITFPDRSQAEEPVEKTPADKK